MVKSYQHSLTYDIFQQHQEDHKFKKNIQKLINANLEKEIKGKAKNFDPKAFEVIDKEAGASTSKEWLDVPYYKKTKT